MILKKAGDRRPTLLIFSQVFVPDPASVGQYMADVAFEMARRGFRVVVCTAARGYDNPAVRYNSLEERHGVQVLRFPLSSFGKRSIAFRVLATAIFMVQCLLVGLSVRRLHGVLFSTSPPLVGAVAVVLSVLRRVPIAYWAMDLNPDQLLALGRIRPGGWIEKSLEAVNRCILRRSTLVVALDRYMAARIATRCKTDHKLLVVPPWPHQTRICPIEPARNPFLDQHNLRGRFVVMYSGNHSLSNPLDTLLEAASTMRHDANVVFVFIGGGTSKSEVEAFARTHRLSNILCLPYWPFDQLSYSLSAADVHVVSLGAGMAGVIHPSKVYGAMAVERPVIYLGPASSHLTDLLDRHGFGIHVNHQDVDATVRAIERIRSAASAGDRSMGLASRAALSDELNQPRLRGKLCTALEHVLRREPFLDYQPPEQPRAGRLANQPNRPMRIAITGGAGFIGSYFVEALRNAGHEPVLFDTHPPDWDTQGATFFQGDIRDRQSLRAAFSGCDAVLHLAAAHHDFGIAPEEYFAVNEDGARSVCEAMDACGITSLCFYSSVAVFGDLPVSPDESTTPEPVSYYGKSKLAGEKVFEAWSRLSPARTCLVIRPTVTFGPRNFANMYSLIRQIHTGRFLPIGRGDNIKSLSYVENIVDATLFLWNLGGVPRMTAATGNAGGGFEVFNYIDKPDLTSRQIVDACYESLGRTVPRFNVPLGLAVVLGLPFDLVIKVTGRNLPVSTARMKKLCKQTKFEADKVLRAGFVPRFSVRQGIDRMVKWYLAVGQYSKPTGPGGAQ